MYLATLYNVVLCNGMPMRPLVQNIKTAGPTLLIKYIIPYIFYKGIQTWKASFLKAVLLQAYTLWAENWN